MEITGKVNAIFSKGAIVLAKLDDYPWWPAIVTGAKAVLGDTDNTQLDEYHVKWFGNWKVQKYAFVFF